MKKFISKKSFIRNLVDRAINGEQQYQVIRDKIAAYGGEVKRLNRWDDSVTDDVIRSKLSHYLELTTELFETIRKLPVVKEVECVTEHRQWAENLVKYLACYPKKGKDLKITYLQIVFAYEKWLNSEIVARNI